MFKKNVGSIDRVIRITLGVAIMGAGVYYQSWWGVLGAIIFATGILSFCALYSLLGISTCPVEPPKNTQQNA
jgi:hypothetical protein